MKKALASLLAAALALLPGAAGATRVRPGSASVPGASALPGVVPVAPVSSDLPLVVPLLPDSALALPSPAALPAAEVSVPAASGGPIAALSEAGVVSAERGGAPHEQAAGRAPSGALKGDRVFDEAAPASEGLGSLPAASSEDGGSSPLEERVWDHATARGFVRALPASEVLAAGSAVPAAALRQDGEVPSRAGPAEPAAPAPSGLPSGFRWFLTAIAALSVGQAVSTVLIPIYAFGAKGLGFAVLAQLAQIIAILPGSYLGAWAVKPITSRGVYIAAAAINSVMFASVPLAVVLYGSFHPWHFLAFSAMGGALYGAVRGAAEQDLMVRLLGKSKAALKRAGSIYYFVVSPIYIAASWFIGGLLAWIGREPLAALGALAMFASIVPLMMIRFPGRGTADPAGPGAGAPSAGLRLGQYLPYVFAWVNHLLLYYIYAPLFALGVFKSEALGGQMIAVYSLGNLVSALSMAFLPRLMGRLSERGWAGVGAASVLALLGIGVWASSPWLVLALTMAFGFAVNANQVQWGALYQARLPVERMPTVFKRLSAAYVLGAFLPTALAQAAISLWSTSAGTLLGAAAFLMAVAAVPMLAFSGSRAPAAPPRDP